MSEETENVPKVEPEAEKMDTTETVAAVVEEKPKVEVKDFVPEMYRLHGGDPRELNLNCAVMVSGIPTDFINDTYEQFNDTLRTMLSASHNLKSETIVKIVRIPVTDETAPNKSNALRALIVFTDKMQQCRCLARKKAFEDDGQRVEALETLPEALFVLSDEDRQILEEGVHEREDEGDDAVEEEVDELELEEEEDDGEGHDEHEEDEDDDGEQEKKEGGNEEKEENVKKEVVTTDAKGADDKQKKAAAEQKEPEPPKKKVYEDEDEKAPFEMKWEGAPEFQWRLCEGNRDEKKLIIENIMWSDLNDVFIYRTIQKATNCEVNFPARFTGEGNRSTFGKLTLTFPGFVAIMDEALKHLVYFRSGDNRRIKVFLPQTTQSLKRKEEFEGKLGRLIKPTPRMMELIVKILPNGYTPTLDDACGWFPDQSVIGCELVMDEMGKPCAVVKFETAQEAIAAHASRSFVSIRQKIEKKDGAPGATAEGGEVKKEEETSSTEVEVKKEEKKDETTKKDEPKEKVSRCNVFMRGVEAHFGSLITFYDQRRKAQEQTRQNRQKRQSTSNSTPAAASAPKRPAGSTIRGPAQKKRAPSPKSRGSGGGNAPSTSTPRGGARNSRGGGGASSGGRRSSPSRSASRPSGGRGISSTRGGGGNSQRGGSGRGGPSTRGGGGGGRSGGGAGDHRGGMNRSGGGSGNNNQRQTNSYRNEAFAGRAPQRAEAFTGYGYANFDRAYSGGGGGSSGNDRPAIDPFGRPMYSVPAFSSSSHHTNTSSSYRDDRGSSGGHGGFSSSSFDNRRRY